MTNRELVEYVKVNIEKGHSKESIRTKLRKHSWPADEINSTFMQLRKEKEPDIPEYESSQSS